MRNPWLARNPWLSLWLSGANTVLGAARAEAQRNATRMMTDGMNQAVRAWSAASAPPAKPARTRRRKR